MRILSTKDLKLKCAKNKMDRKKVQYYLEDKSKIVKKR